MSDPVGWLFKDLASKSRRLAGTFRAVQKKAAEQLLPFTQLPGFTDHGVKHAMNVQENLCRLIPRDLPEPLSAFEIFALLCATVLHDVGMLVSNVPGEPSREIRVDHFKRSQQFVIRNYAELGLSEQQARIVGEICRSHGMPNLDYLAGQLYSLRPFGEIRVPLLSALLRLADILDVTYERAPSIVAKNRQLGPTSRRHWEVHRSITDVQICTAPSWDIRLVAMPKKHIPDMPFYELRDSAQRELETTCSILRSAGIFFQKIELTITRSTLRAMKKRHNNPFLLLAPYTSREAARFGGRDREIQDVIERVVGRRLVIVIGESGVGKTSLVDAGVIPQLRTYKFGVIRFSFQDDPMQDLLNALRDPTKRSSGSDDVLGCIRQYFRAHRRATNLLLVGDHLEQMFTIDSSCAVRQRFLRDASRILGSNERVTLLFCIREDYLPDLYNISLDMPELYNRNNTFRLHRLSKENAVAALRRASSLSYLELAPALIERIADDLSYEGAGMVYPPFLQIVGSRLYGRAKGRGWKGSDSGELPERLYQQLGGVETIVNHYLDGLLDQYAQHDKAIVVRILGMMVTEHRTKKRVQLDQLKRAVPECPHVERLIAKLVQQRIVRRSLGDYELIHDFLAQKVIDLVKKKRFLSPPVRAAIAFIESNCHRNDITCEAIAKAAHVTQTHLGSLFRDQLGITLTHQLGHTRVAKAKALLSENRDPLSEIAARTGFKSLSSFSRKFKELERVSALEYRRSLVASDPSETRRTHSAGIGASAAAKEPKLRYQRAVGGASQ